MEEQYKKYKDKNRRREYLRKYRKIWEEKNPERTKKKYLKYHANLRKKAINILGGPKCSNCGCTVFEILEINHLNGGGRKEARSGKATFSYLRDIIHGRVDVKKYDILCRVCNSLHYVEQLLGIKGHKVIWEK